jgi:hypothetical protein
MYQNSPSLSSIDILILIWVLLHRTRRKTVDLVGEFGM